MTMQNNTMTPAEQAEQQEQYENDIVCDFDCDINHEHNHDNSAERGNQGMNEIDEIRASILEQTVPFERTLQHPAKFPENAQDAPILPMPVIAKIRELEAEAKAKAESNTVSTRSILDTIRERQENTDKKR